MEKKSDFIPDPIIGHTFEKDLHLFDTKRHFHAKDDVKALKHFASKFGKSRVTGEERKSYSEGLEFLQNAVRILQEDITSELQNG